MDKEALLEETYDSAFKDELEKAASGGSATAKYIRKNFHNLSKKDLKPFWLAPVSNIGTSGRDFAKVQDKEISNIGKYILDIKKSRAKYNPIKKSVSTGRILRKAKAKNAAKKSLEKKRLAGMLGI